MTMELHETHGVTTERRPANRSAASYGLGLLAVLIGGGLTAAHALIPRGHEAERASIARMGAPERQALFAATRQSAESICAASESEVALIDRCQDLAKFMQAFSSECDDGCRAFGRAHQPRSIAR